MIDWEKHKFNEVVNIVGEYTVLVFPRAIG